MIWAIVSSLSCFCWLYRASPSSATKNKINLISVIDHLVVTACSHLFCCWKRVLAMTSAFSWQNSVSLCPASFCTPRPIWPVIPSISWLPNFAIQSPIVKRTSFLRLVLESLFGLHGTSQLQLPGISGWGPDLDYCPVERFAWKQTEITLFYFFFF